MPAVDVPPNNPYPGARSIYQLPVPATHRQIISWGFDGFSGQASGEFTSATAQWVTDGIQQNDPLVIIFSTQSIVFSTTVFEVLDEGIMLINYMAPEDLTNCFFKCGAAAVHTLQTLAARIKLLSLGSRSFRWGNLWSQIEPVYYDPGTAGHLITI